MIVNIAEVISSSPRTVWAGFKVGLRHFDKPTIKQMADFAGNFHRDYKVYEQSICNQGVKLWYDKLHLPLDYRELAKPLLQLNAPTPFVSVIFLIVSTRMPSGDLNVFRASELMPADEQPF